MHWKMVCAACYGTVDRAAMHLGHHLTASRAGLARRGQRSRNCLIARVPSLDHFSDVAADNLLRFTVLQWHANLTNN